jgi:hypothetical protein
MRRILFALLLVVASSLHADPSTETASAGTWQLQYATALESIAKADTPTKKFLGDYDTVPLDPKAQAILKQFGPALQSVRDGANADLHPTTPKVQDMTPLLKELGNARLLFSLTMLQARAELDAGDNAAAVTDLVAAIALGRNISREPIIISNLVGIAVESGAMEELAKLLTSLPPDARATLRKQYESLPEAMKFSEVVHGEQALAPQLLTRQMGAAAPAEIKKLSPFYDAVAKAADESPKKFSELAHDAANASQSPLAKTLAPAFIGPFRAYLRLQVERAMFLAAFDVCDNGAQSIQNTSDPAGEGPFKFEATPEGFKLSSALTDKEGKPVTLVVGK